MQLFVMWHLGPDTARDKRELVCFCKTHEEFREEKLFVGMVITVVWSHGKRGGGKGAG